MAVEIFRYTYFVFQVPYLLIECNIIRCYKSLSPGLYPSLCSWASMPLSCSAPIMRHRTKGLHFVECSMLLLGVSSVPAHTLLLLSWLLQGKFNCQSSILCGRVCTVRERGYRSMKHADTLASPCANIISHDTHTRTHSTNTHTHTGTHREMICWLIARRGDNFYSACLFFWELDSNLFSCCSRFNLFT